MFVETDASYTTTRDSTAWGRFWRSSPQTWCSFKRSMLVHRLRWLLRAGWTGWCVRWKYGLLSLTTCRCDGEVSPSEEGHASGNGGTPFEAVRLPERMLTASVVLDGRLVTVVSYHAPPGVTWGMDKVRHAWACQAWLHQQPEPVVMGADANTPEFDMPDFRLTRTHWHTGMRKLVGERGCRRP